MFKDRHEAGKQLAQKLLPYKSKKAIILALPRGGLEIGYELAKELKIPLDIIVSKKIGYPGDPELAIGAVSMDKVAVIDEGMLKGYNISQDYIEKEKERLNKEIEEKYLHYRGSSQRPDFKNYSVILTDDGIATGQTMLAAVKFLKTQNPKEITVAIPVLSKESLEVLKKEVNQVTFLDVPPFFGAVGAFYENFPQVEDELAIEYLKKANLS